MQQNHLFQNLFKRKSTDAGTKDFLLQLTKDHPYFSPAQFYLLQQTGNNEIDYTRQAARANIFFENPYWLNFQLTNAQQSFDEKTIEENILEEKIIEQSHVGLIINPAENSDNDDDESVIEEEIVPLNFELKLPEENKNVSTESMVFEPLHMVDYFASQGIKLNEEIQPADKLGKQLKSFTEWLKTMKKIHTNESSQNNEAVSSSVLLEQGSAQTDTNIQTLADKSNAGDEVLTESMADVFAKQGKTGKAIELYQKLSLLDPTKIAYFAAKIEQLKRI